MWERLTKLIGSSRSQYQNKEGFLAAIRDAWNNRPQHYFRNLCLPLLNRSNKIIESNGKMTKYSIKRRQNLMLVTVHAFVAYW